jgi:hypothetical protein
VPHRMMVFLAYGDRFSNENLERKVSLFFDLLCKMHVCINRQKIGRSRVVNDQSVGSSLYHIGDLLKESSNLDENSYGHVSNIPRDVQRV